MLRESVSQAASRLSGVRRRAERTEDAIYDVAGGESEGVVEMIGTMLGACETAGVEEVGARTAVWGGAGEAARLRSGIR